MASTEGHQDISEKVAELRETFLKSQGAAIENGTYDERDVERVRSNDSYLKCFLRSFGKNDDVTKPLEMLNTVLTFRKSIAINDLKEETFPKEFGEQKVIYWHGVDNENRKILHLKVARHKKGSQFDEMKQYIAWYLEEHHKVNLYGARIAMIFDFTDAGISNVDLDLVRYIITCLSTYFPGILSYILLFEMPWLLSSVWKIIQSWLTKEQRDVIILVKKADMPKYIPKDQLEEHMITA